MATRIPNLYHGNKATKLQNVDNKLPRKSIAKERVSIAKDRLSIAPDRYFTNPPNLQHMANRNLPEEITSQTSKIGGKLLDVIYRHTKEIGHTMFNSNTIQNFFPKEFRTLKQSIVEKTFSKSKLPVKNNSKKTDLSMAFECLNDLLSNRISTLFAITDFVLLYCSLVILICDDDEISKSLVFLRKFLVKDIPVRVDEIRIVFSAIICCKSTHPTVKGFSIQVLPLLIKYDSMIYARLESGSTHHDLKISEICQSALKQIPERQSAGIGESLTRINNEFSLIPPESDEKAVISLLKDYQSLIKDGKSPQNGHAFIKNLVVTMKKFRKSSSILFLAALCYIQLFDLFQPIENEILGETLSLCFSVLQVGSEIIGDYGFEARDNLLTLVHTIYQRIPIEAALTATAAAVSSQTEGALTEMLNYFQEYFKQHQYDISKPFLDDIAIQIHAFHPHYPLPHYLQQEKTNLLDEMTTSIRKLHDPNYLFIEMERIVQSMDSDLINSYPLYLRGFLQRAYYFYHNEIPDGMEQHQIEICETITHRFHNSIEGQSNAFSPESLQRELVMILEKKKQNI